MNEPTSFSEVYEMFMHGITDDMYISWTRQETYEDLKPFLQKAVARFRYPKVVLTYNAEDEEFTNTLNTEEIFILSLLMSIEWIDRQMLTVRLTELQYTGSDAKVLGTKAQMSALVELRKTFVNDLEKQLKYYHRHSRIDDKIMTADGITGLSGKGAGLSDSIQTFKQAR